MDCCRDRMGDGLLIICVPSLHRGPHDTRAIDDNHFRKRDIPASKVSTAHHTPDIREDRDRPCRVVRRKIVSEGVDFRGWWNLMLSRAEEPGQNRPIDDAQPSRPKLLCERSQDRINRRTQLAPFGGKIDDIDMPVAESGMAAGTLTVCRDLNPVLRCERRRRATDQWNRIDRETRI